MPVTTLAPCKGSRRATSGQRSFSRWEGNTVPSVSVPANSNAPVEVVPPGPLSLSPTYFVEAIRTQDRAVFRPQPAEEDDIAFSHASVGVDGSVTYFWVNLSGGAISPAALGGQWMNTFRTGARILPVPV